MSPNAPPARPQPDMPLNQGLNNVSNALISPPERGLNYIGNVISPRPQAVVDSTLAYPSQPPPPPVSFYDSIKSSLGLSKENVVSVAIPSSTLSTDSPSMFSGLFTTILIVIIFSILLYIAIRLYNRQNDDERRDIRVPYVNTEEVYNVPGNYYTYNQAPGLCKALGSRIATYDEVEKAYNDGAEWCNYGWSDNQLALFPTQKATYSKLQSIKGHENDCGRPGVNGGYIANENIRFGVNCYGKKQKMSDAEGKLLELDPMPVTKEDQLMEKQVAFWTKHVDDILLSPFNYNHWSKY